MEIGDFVKGLADNGYGITNEEMTRGIVTAINGSKITVKVLDHSDEKEHGAYSVLADKFEIIGHAKAFNCDEVLELLKSGCKKAVLDYDLSGANLRSADLSRANLRSADLSGADLDFSCYPLWCGSLRLKADKRIACQLAYHLCSMQCATAFSRLRISSTVWANVGG